MGDDGLDMMRVALVWISLLAAAPLLSAAGGPGQSGELPPETIPEQPTPLPNPAVDGGALFPGAGESPHSSLEELKGNSLKLKELRQALQEESLLAKTGQETKNPPSLDNSQLKLRLLELMTKLNAQKNKLPPDPEAHDPPAVKGGKPGPLPKNPKQEDKRSTAPSE